MLIFFIAFTITICYCDHMEWTEYWKLCNLANELVVAANNKIHQTDNIRDMVSNENGFQIGLIMGRIRDKYRSMLELYRLAKNKFINRPKINFPAMPVIKPLYYIVRMELIHALEVDIDNLVQILEAIPADKLKPSMNSPSVWRGDGKGTDGFDKLRQLEEEMKGKNREEYHLRKLNLMNGTALFF